MKRIIIKVAVKVVINDGKGNIIIGKRKFEPDAGTWDAPGGLVEVGETFDFAGAREVREETGLDVKVGALLDIQEIITPKRHSVLLYFRGKLLGGRLKGGDDLAEPKWISLKSASKHENLRPAFARVLEKMTKK